MSRWIADAVPGMAYCDYIADCIVDVMKEEDQLIDYVGPVEMDLHPTEGYMLSTKKSMSIVDSNGKRYKITVEEV
jgi:hypothetical protein